MLRFVRTIERQLTCLPSSCTVAFQTEMSPSRVRTSHTRSPSTNRSTRLDIPSRATTGSDPSKLVQLCSDSADAPELRHARSPSDPGRRESALLEHWSPPMIQLAGRSVPVVCATCSHAREDDRSCGPEPADPKHAVLVHVEIVTLSRRRKASQHPTADHLTGSHHQLQILV